MIEKNTLRKKNEMIVTDLIYFNSPISFRLINYPIELLITVFFIFISGNKADNKTKIESGINK